MDRNKLDSILLETRLTIVELMVARLTVAIKASKLSGGRSEALSELLAEYEDIAKSLESSALSDPRFQVLTAEERALFADEYREMIDRSKDQFRSIFD